MKVKNKLIKIFLVILLGSAAVNLSLVAMNEAIIYSEIKKNNYSCFPGQSYNPPNVVSPFNQTKSDLLGYLFQIMFILFFISPPLIVLMLCLIWKELREKNKMK